MMEKNPYLQRLEALRSERESFISHYREMSEFIQPRRGRFLVEDRNRGDKRNQKIINNTCTRALRILSSGMMAGITSPARPWFRLATPDPELMETESVRTYLHDVEKIMREVYSRSNFYNAMQTVYQELPLFGTAANMIVEDYSDVIRCYPHTAGGYFIAQNDRLVVDVFYQEYDLTVAQVVKKFGLDKVSQVVRDGWKNGRTEQWVTCVHLIEPNDDRIEGAVGAKGMPFRQVYFEKSRNDGEYLSVMGFEEFPVTAPRWEVAGTDVYGTNCPGMEVLGDVKQLQHQEIRKAEGIDKTVRPPMKGPSALKNKEIHNVPGGVTFYDEAGNSRYEPAYTVNLPLQYLTADIKEIERRIESTFYVDLFLAITTQDGRMTATEVAERHEEKLIMLGPVLERVQNELLAPAVDRTFAIMQRGGLLPPAPQELQNMELKVEFISLLAQAQRLVGIGGIDRFMAYVGSVAQMNPSALDKVDFDQSIDEYGEILGVPPRIIVSDDKVEEIRAARAQQEQMMQAAAVAPAVSDVAKSLSQTQTVGNNALAAIMGNA